MTSNPSSDTKITLFISIVDKKDYLKVECQSSDSIHQLKQLIEKAIKKRQANTEEDKLYEANDQILVCHQQTLDDSQRIEEYKIKNDGIIFMYSNSNQKNMKHKSQKVK